jgi:hypothetical protein
VVQFTVYSRCKVAVVRHIVDDKEAILIIKLNIKPILKSIKVSNWVLILILQFDLDKYGLCMIEDKCLPDI